MAVEIGLPYLLSLNAELFCCSLGYLLTHATENLELEDMTR